MKKKYMKPQLTAVVIQNESALLTASVEVCNDAKGFGFDGADYDSND